MEYRLHPIGRVEKEQDSVVIKLEPCYAPALTGLAEYSHVQILWWFSHTDDADSRSRTLVRCPYLGAPQTLGVFATRTPFRPNPIALSCSRILKVDVAAGRLVLERCDAQEGTPIIDLKPYAPSSDRVENPVVPGWSAHWPNSLEAYDWEREMDPDFHQ